MMDSLSTALHNIYTNLPLAKHTHRLFLMQSLGEILAEDIIATENSPEFETSAMDGYAIRYEDQSLGELFIENILPAGTDISTEVTTGKCVKTFTGSLMSRGSDTIIPIENVEVIGSKIKIIKPVSKGFSVREVGENYQKGEVLLQKGTQIGYAEIGVLAALNYVQISVYQKPRVGIIATGSEIVEVGETMHNASQIRSTNHFSLEALCIQNGALVNRYGIVGDDKEKIKKAIVDSLQNDDVVITTGGVSVGDFDFVKDILNQMDIEYIIDKVHIKPGRHIKALKVANKYIFAFPGFPYSSIVTCIFFALPVLWALQGWKKKHQMLSATFCGEYKKQSIYEEIIACDIEFRDGKYFANISTKRSGSSAIMTNLLQDAAFFITDKDLADGDEVSILKLR